MQVWCSCNYTISHSLVRIGGKIDQQWSSRHVQGNWEWGWECLVLGISVPKTWRKIPWYCERYRFCIPEHLYGLDGMCEVNWVLIRGCDPLCRLLHWPGVAASFPVYFSGFCLGSGLDLTQSCHTFYIRCIRSLVFLLLRSHTPLVQPLCYVEAISFFFLTCKHFQVFFHSASFNGSPLSSGYHPIFLLEGTRPFIIWFLPISPVLPSLSLLALVLGGISALYTC